MERRKKDHEEQVLFPARQYQVLSGQRVTIEPWGLSQGELLMPRVGALIEELGGDFSAGKIARTIRKNQAEVREIVRETIGWTPEEMEQRLKYEDLFVLAQGVIEVCLLRGEDVGGVVGKVLALAGTRAGALLAKTSRGSRSSSAPTGTAGETSEGTPSSS